MNAESSDLDRSAAAPLYLQIVESLRREILGHDLPPGAALPSESDLQQRFGVSRSVVRQAIARLAEDGLVHRHQGRPSIVAPQPEHRRLVQRATGMFDQFARTGRRLSTRIDAIEREVPPPEAQAYLRTRETLRLERLRSIDGEPLSYVRTWLPRARVPDLTAAELTDASLHKLLSTKFGLRAVSGRRQVRAVAADERLAVALEVPPGAPLLLLEGETGDQHGNPLEWFTTWHRADKVVFDIDVTEGAELLSLDPAGARPAEEPPAGDEIARARDLVAELGRLLG
ncbi:GntR family transcriptional regulator [Kribbella sp. VKM Ac-2568]|uniref:GntR family transcriptional regulator n=1 Tax=Kribbella sp. VKM Ac-2568 TaxID=2512219 RepID=UPI00104D5551|nr:GntR family transcriptional regulator [Kribbella sp. VKM Ac-2568]TCM49138.1 GntR family transcriptional regulator [Kribbella sp. VKM Ac-2568]